MQEGKKAFKENIPDTDKQLQEKKKTTTTTTTQKNKNKKQTGCGYVQER